MTKINIAIDGPSGSGKGTTSKILAKKLGYNFLDTGAMYRAIAYYLHTKGILKKDFEESQLRDIKLSFNDENHICLNEIDIEKEIRTPLISQLASDFSTIPQVRQFLVKKQQEIIQHRGYIAEGRDIGSKVMPYAELKIYLDAHVEERAKRRLRDFQNQGLNYSLDDVIEQIEERDRQDMNRQTDPLVKLPDAIVIDTTNLSVEEQVEVINYLALKILNKK